MHVKLDLTERLADPMIERLAIVMRMGPLTDSTLIATKLAPLTRLLVASPTYPARASTPTSAADTSSHRLLNKLRGADLLGWRDVLGCPAIQERVSNQPFFGMNSMPVASKAA